MKTMRIVAVLALGTACSAGREATWQAPAAQQAQAGESAEQLIASGDEHFKNRADRAALEKAIGAYTRATELAPDDHATLGKLARAWYFLADGHLRKEEPYEKSPAYMDALEKGTSAGERGMAAASPEFKAQVVAGEKVEKVARLLAPAALIPAYWSATNLGKWAKAKGLAARLANKDKAKAVMTRCLEIEEGFFHGAPHRYFGAYHALAPDGVIEKSKEHFDKALALAPNYVGTKVLYAENYAVKKDDRALFDKLLDEVLNTPDDALPDVIPETKNEKDKAAGLKAKAGELF